VPIFHLLPGSGSKKHLKTGGRPMKNLCEKFRGVVPKNNKRRETKHPEFAGTLTIWNSIFSCAAWLNTKRDGEVYVTLRLSSDGGTQSEKLKFALWKNRERSTESDPNFRSTQSAYDHKFSLKAWIVPYQESHGLVLEIEPSLQNIAPGSAAILETDRKIADILAESLPALPPVKQPATSLSDLSQDGELEDIPF
jgi:hypothetical protein